MDKFDEAAKKVYDTLNDRWESNDDLPPIIAAFGRQCADEARAEAFRDASEAVGDMDCYCSQHDEHPEGLCLIKARALTKPAQAGEKKA